MVKLQDDSIMVASALDESFFDPPTNGHTKMGNFVFDRNGQINIDRTVEDAYGFRLQEINHNTEMSSTKEDACETATSVSGYSNYKQRIDAMFDDTRSLASEKGKHKRAEDRLKLLETYEESLDRTISNNIQEKIEKMFQEISIHGFQPSDSFKNFKNRKSLKHQPQTNTLSHDFSVVYLGSHSLEDKSVSLVNLQDPLKELYFEYKRKHIPEQFDVLAISREGLKIKIGDREHLNPFPTIAVWASVKLTFRTVGTGTEFAFLPLVTDPDGMDKNILFKHLRNEDKNAILNKTKGALDEDDQSPIFTVVMKNLNLNKQLECHGFVCKSSEEAIVIAANLYQALMKKMKRKKEAKPDKSYENCNKTEHSEPEPKVEVAKEEVKNEVPKEAPKKEFLRKPIKKTAPPVPARPQRKPKKFEEDLIELDEEEEEEEENNRKPKLDNKLLRRGSVPNNVFTIEHEPVSTLRRSVSERRNSGMAITEDRGDILTKVAIPRSRSFLNANGPLTRYSRRYKSSAHNDIASPLGFNELFNEFRLNEGLESMDDILNAIIDAEGMSFNDLKPIYKEFLLKLAVTLTKDELYQRSKIIMRRQRKKTHLLSRKTFISTTGLRKVFRKTASKLSKPKSSRPASLEFTSVVFQSSGKRFEASTSSTSSGGHKTKPGVKRRQSSRRRVVKKTDKPKSKKLSTTSEDSDFALRRNTVESGGGPNRSSSGYFSCSECSYDSENCTCTSADKCYCTLGQGGHNKKKIVHNTSTVESKFSEKDKSNPSLDVEIAYEKDEKDKGSVTSCGCDTESCADSEKCYCREGSQEQLTVMHLSEVKGICQTPHLHQNHKTHNAGCPNFGNAGCKKHGQTIIEQLKQQGFAASESSLSRAASPSTAWRNNEEKMRRPKECLKTSRSLEFLQIRRPEARQQMNDCPPPPQASSQHPSSAKYPNFEEILLKEIQNTRALPVHSYVEGTRHFCYHGPDIRDSVRRRSMADIGLQRRRQYSSMRSRSEYPAGLNQFHSCRYKSRLFSSMRSKQPCDNILNHVLFPESNGSRNSSLRFPRRMDVYNSFHKRGPLERQGSYIDLLNRIQSNFQPAYYPQPRPERVPHVCTHETPQIYQSSGGSDNFQKLDYDLFTTSAKSEASETISNGSDRKVLVVSARDPKGKVLYMGASSRGEKAGRTASRDYTDTNSANACEALSVKKSAEIAALFADVPKMRAGQYRSCQRSNSYRSTNMENTLGYLP